MGKRPNNYPTSQKYDTLPGELGEVISFMDKMRKLPPVRKHEPEKVKERLDEFFKYCIENDKKPTVELMQLALGISRQALWVWEHEDSETGQLIVNAKALINALLTDMTIEGKANPVYSIWLQKNHHNYSDVQQIELVNPEQKTIGASGLKQLGEQMNASNLKLLGSEMSAVEE